MYIYTHKHQRPYSDLSTGITEKQIKRERYEACRNSCRGETGGSNYIVAINVDRMPPIITTTTDDHDQVSLFLGFFFCFVFN